MAIDTEVLFDYTNRRIYRHGSATSAIESVNALYSHIQDTFDELTEMDDKVPMSAATPTSYKLDNGWYLEEEVMRHLDGGAIETTGYTNEVYTIEFVGDPGTVAGDIGKTVTGSTTGTIGILLDYDNTAQKWWVRTGGVVSLDPGETIEVTTDGGTGTGTESANATGETLFANPYTLGTLFTTLPLYIIQDSVEVTSYYADGAFDILIKVMEADVDIDSRKITVFGRKWGEAYTNFNITLTSAGQNAVPLGTANDLNVDEGTYSEAAIQALADTDIGGDLSTGINILFNSSPYSYDIGDGNGEQNYNIQIDCNNRPLSDVYMVTMWATRDGSTSQLDNDGTTDDGQEYISYNAGWSPVVTAPFGSFAGGKFFGARGVYFINLHADDAQAFQLIDSSGTTRNPPNYQAFAMTGLTSGDKVSVYESTGASSTAVKKNQYTLAAGNNVLNELTVSVAIPSSTPATGSIIVVADDGSELSYVYSAWDTSTFDVTIAADTYTGGQASYVPFLYAVSGGVSVTDTTTIYTGLINVVGRVRRAGFLPYEAAGTFGATGFSAIGTVSADPIYTA